MTEPETLVLQLLRDMRGEMKDMRAEMVTKGELAEVNGRIAGVDARLTSLAADVASDLLTTERRLSEQITGLRRAVVDYHSSVIGHGVLIGDLDERLRRVEKHLNLPGSDSH